MTDPRDVVSVEQVIVAPPEQIFDFERIDALVGEAC
jgi:hypothetical protein